MYLTWFQSRIIFDYKRPSVSIKTYCLGILDMIFFPKIDFIIAGFTEK